MKGAKEYLASSIRHISLINLSAKHSRGPSFLLHLLFDPGISCHFNIPKMYHFFPIPSISGVFLNMYRFLTLGVTSASSPTLWIQQVSPLFFCANKLEYISRSDLLRILV